MNTRHRIEEAVFQLANEKPLEKMTVCDILARANVSRSTFYSYFTDKYDAVNSYCRSIATDIFVHTETRGWFVTFMNLNRFAYQHRKFFRFYFKNYAEAMDNFSKKQLYAFGQMIYCSDGETKQTLTEKERFQLVYAMNGTMEILKEWIMNDCKLSVEEFSEFGYSLFPKVSQFA